MLRTAHCAHCMFKVLVLLGKGGRALPLPGRHHPNSPARYGACRAALTNAPSGRKHVGAHRPGPHSCTSRPTLHQGGHALPACAGAMRRFRERVEAELPGMYCFFHEASLHVTLRSLMG